MDHTVDADGDWYSDTSCNMTSFAIQHLYGYSVNGHYTVRLGLSMTSRLLPLHYAICHFFVISDNYSEIDCSPK